MSEKCSREFTPEPPLPEVTMESHMSSSPTIAIMSEQCSRESKQNPEIAKEADRPDPQKLVQYRSWTHDITFYQFSHDFMSLPSFVAKLTLEKHGFMGRRDSREPTHREIPSVEDLPDGQTEVIYLPAVYKINGAKNAKGSALGFCMEVVVVWLTFDRNVEPFIKAFNGQRTTTKLFEERLRYLQRPLKDEGLSRE
jgi:hypothetical protein